MKNLLIIALLCLTFFAGQSVLAQTNDKDAAQETKPTFEETMKWLQKQFEDYAGFNGFKGCKDPTNCTDEKKTIERFDEKNLVIKIIYKFSDGTGFEYIYEAPWTDLDNTINTDNSLVFIETVNEKRSIKQTLYKDGEVRKELVSSILISFTTDDIGTRVAKALNHAITLRGGGKKKEIF